MPSALLLHHPATPCDAIKALAVDVDLGRDGWLKLLYSVAGDIGRLRVPAMRPPSRAHRLWRHTCFEAFIAAPGATACCECNFAPSTEWAAYRFSAYREGMRVAEAVRPPSITVSRDAHRLELEAVLCLEGLPEVGGTGAFRLALSAVIEETDGRRSYWALAHPPGQPDFHHRGSFILDLVRPGVV